MNSSKLKEIYENKRQRVEQRFPGSFVAGPANYPVENHRRAWKSVWDSHTKWQLAFEKEQKAIKYKNYMKKLTEQTNNTLIAEKNPLGSAQLGQSGKLFWTNCGRSYSARVKIVKLNAVSIRIELVSELPEEYKGCEGRQWSISKHNTKENKLELD